MNLGEVTECALCVPGRDKQISGCCWGAVEEGNVEGTSAASRDTAEICLQWFSTRTHVPRVFTEQRYLMIMAGMGLFDGWDIDFGVW